MGEKHGKSMCVSVRQPEFE